MLLPVNQIKSMIDALRSGNFKTLSRAISFVENAIDGFKEMLALLPASTTKITGITGPPGAGKSTLTDALIGAFVQKNKKVAVLCVDPSSALNKGALLGDRLRMGSWYNHPSVFIRSLATRGSLGGLHPHIIEITELTKAAGFDHIIIETVGVGQSEIEIAGLADTTIVVLVPESGDEIQTMKAGLMEIADIFVVNKSDRPAADSFVKNLKLKLAPVYNQSEWDIPVIKTIAVNKSGIDELYNAIIKQQEQPHNLEKQLRLKTEKVFQLVAADRMKNIDKNDIMQKLRDAGNAVNLYAFSRNYNVEAIE